MDPFDERGLAKARFLGNNYTRDRRNNIWRRDGGRCVYCSIPLTRKSMTIDHVVARFNGGTDDESNLVLCCRRCNDRKGDMSLEDFRHAMRWELSGMPNFSPEQVIWLRNRHQIVVRPTDTRFWFERRLEGAPPIHDAHRPANLIT